MYELVKVEGYTYKKTAGVMHISPFTVKEYLVAANKSVKKIVAVLNNEAVRGYMEDIQKAMHQSTSYYLASVNY